MIWWIFDEIWAPFEREGKLYFEAKEGRKRSIRDKNWAVIWWIFDVVSIFDDFFVWKTDNTFEKIYFSQAWWQQLTEQQKDKLDLLNLTTTTKWKEINKLRADIDDYKHKQEQKFTEIQKQEKKKKYVSKTHLAWLNAMIKNFPWLFLDTMSTKNTRLENIVSDNLLINIYPEMFAEEKRNLRNGFKWYIWLWWGNNLQEERPEDYLSQQESSEMNGGSPETENGTPKEIMKIRWNIDGVIVSGIYGNYDENTTKRHKSYFHVDTKIIWPKTTTTITLPHINTSRPIILPKPINSNVVESRVKWIKKNWEEVFIVPEINSLNEAKVSIGNDIKEIIYSIETPKIQANIPDISNDEYQRFKQSIEKDMDSNELTKPLCNISDDSKLFLQSISTLSPKQKIITIEQYVRDKSFYDYGNKEVMDIKRWKSIEEKNYICEQRIDELQQRKPELKNILDWKKRAGVCADFATILIGELLREAWFVSWVISWFLATGQSVTWANAHGVAYVVMPNARGKNQIIIVDGTPHGSWSASTPSLWEKEKDIEEKKEELKSDLQKKLDIIESIIDSSDDIDFIKNELSQLYNWNLEDMMNAILANDVNIQNYTTIENILNAYRYSPITKEQDKEKIKSFLLWEMKPQLSKQDNNDKLQIKWQAWSMMFDMVNDFMERFTKSDKVNLWSKLDALNLLDTIIDMIGDSLSKVEFKSTKLIIKYLKAENIKGKVK